MRFSEDALKPNRRLLFITISILFALVFAGGAWHLGVFAPTFQQVAHKPIESIAMHDSRGQKHSFSELAGKRTILYFWTTWCGPCRGTLSSLNKLPPNGKLSENFIAVALSTNQKLVAEIIKDTGYSGEYWLADEGQSILQRRLFGNESRAVPYIIELDEHNQIVRASHDPDEFSLIANAKLGKL